MKNILDYLSQLIPFLGLGLFFLLGGCVNAFVRPKKWFHYIIDVFGIICGIMMPIVIWQTGLKWESILILGITMLISWGIYTSTNKNKKL